MTVADLIARLQELPAHHTIIISGVDCYGYSASWKTDFEAINYPNKGLVTLTGEGNDCSKDGEVW